jgi:hypothetical protein
MLELEFAAQDAVYPRFTFSPLWEVFASVRVLNRPGDHSAHQSWATHTRSRLAASGLDWGLLSELVAVPVPELPGFLLAPGSSVVPDLGVELAALRAAPVGRVRAGIARLPEPRTARLTALHDDPSDATSGLPGLAGVIERYWELAIAPHWPRMLALLESDVLYRGRLLAEGGAPRLLGDLESPVTWQDWRGDGASATAGPDHRGGRGAAGAGGGGGGAAARAGAGPAVSAPPPGDVARELDLRRLIREGGLGADGFGPWLETLLERSTRLHHPGELAHQVASPDVPAALADLVHGAINQPMSIYEMGAAANAIEAAIVEWMCERVGWGDGAGGVLTHGGSLANLTALLTAIANTSYYEYFPGGWHDEAGREIGMMNPPVPVDGHIAPPSGPGWGADWDWKRFDEKTVEVV